MELGPLTQIFVYWTQFRRCYLRLSPPPTVPRSFFLQSAWFKPGEMSQAIRGSLVIIVGDQHTRPAECPFSWVLSTSLPEGWQLSPASFPLKYLLLQIFGHASPQSSQESDAFSIRDVFEGLHQELLWFEGNRSRVWWVQTQLCPWLQHRRELPWAAPSPKTQKLCSPCPGNGPWLRGKKDPVAHALEPTADQRERDFGILPYPKAN